MSAPKSLFAKQDDLRKKLLEVTTSEWFRQCLVYTQAEMMSRTSVSAENIAGANLFVSTLLGMCDDEPTDKPVIKSGLVHDLQPVKPLDQPKSEKV